MREASIGYFCYYTMSNELLKFLQNAVLLQLFCETPDISYIFPWAELGRLRGLDEHCALGAMAKLLNKEHFYDVDHPQATYPGRHRWYTLWNLSKTLKWQMAIR